MTHCPSCKSALAASALTCPQCGAALDDTSSPTAMLPEKPAARVTEPSADGARFAAGTMLTERYRIVSLLGRGGMGEVYKAEDWFDAKRLKDDYVPTGFKGYSIKTRAVKGHEFGLELSAEDKRALIAFLKTL